MFDLLEIKQRARPLINSPTLHWASTRCVISKCTTLFSLFCVRSELILDCQTGLSSSKWAHNRTQRGKIVCNCYFERFCFWIVSNCGRYCAIVLYRYLHPATSRALHRWCRRPKGDSRGGQVCPATLCFADIWGESGGCRSSLTTAARLFPFHHGCKSHQAPVSAERWFPPNSHLWMSY